MSKSPLAIAVLGAAACLALSLSMQHLLDVKQERAKPPLLREIEAQFGDRLTAPVRVGEQLEGGRRRLCIDVEVFAGLRKERFAESVGRCVWTELLGGKDQPHELVIAVADDAGGPVATVVVPPPVRRR